MKNFKYKIINNISNNNNNEMKYPKTKKSWREEKYENILCREVLLQEISLE